MEKRRVVVTGLGTVNPLGNTVPKAGPPQRPDSAALPHHPVRYRWVQVQTGG